MQHVESQPMETQIMLYYTITNIMPIDGLVMQGASITM